MLNGEKIFNNLKEKYYTEGRTDKFKVLFCPYKWEMWDCMATIYGYAKRDSDTEVKIMPIPYFTLQNMKPKALKMDFIEHQKEFPNALNEKWDIIIFHYPYDNCNSLTRPLLFSSNLKCFCKHLVLTEYFVIGNRMPSVTELSCPGVRNADLIIYETEEQAEYAKKELSGKSNAECVGWGSAKYDLLKSEKSTPPVVWEQKMRNRKVILLQTSIVPYMNNPHKLEQIEQILDKYEKNNNVCLIWRPHPLYRDTVIAYSPHNLKKFDSLVERVEKSDKDIFDYGETAELTMNLADEMISDRSSLVTLWQTTGKKLTLLER